MKLLNSFCNIDKKMDTKIFILIIFLIIFFILLAYFFRTKKINKEKIQNDGKPPDDIYPLY